MRISELNSSTSLMAEMANLYPHNTGVKYVMWFGEVGGQHGPRIKVSNKRGKFALDDNFVLTVNRVPSIAEGHSKLKTKDLLQIINWIKLNYNNLMLLWKIHETGDAIMVNGSTMDINEVLAELQKI